MPEIPLRLLELDPGIEADIDRVLRSRFGLGLDSSKELADAVQRMSDYYLENPDDPTPWNERWAKIAQLAYYFPLNFLRARAVAEEARRRGFLDGTRGLLDFGSGLGPVERAFRGLHALDKVESIEQSGEARDLARELGSTAESVGAPSSSGSALPGRIAPGRESSPPESASNPGSRPNENGKRPDARATTLLSFSYSLTELDRLPAWATGFDSILVIEPSTRQDGRRLLERRKSLLADGYFMWAPCPHQQDCPLLERHPHDWCHDRIHFARPDWWLRMEERLPFKNPTLTFSYLLASRRRPPAGPKAVRVVGDLLREKGKSRQMICRNSEREFFSWLKRQGEPPEIPRGTLLIEPTETVNAGSELRPTGNLEPFD